MWVIAMSPVAGDLNAALNIERFGLSLSSLRLVDGVVPTPPVETSKNQFV
jgi:hypothetical protein